MASSSNLVYRSAVWSLVAQLLLGAFTLVGLFVDIPEESRNDLQLIFGLELGSQVIELLWYAVVVSRYRKITTWTRYIDWVFSTPIMLISTLFFFRHRSGDSLIAVFESEVVYVLLGLNWAMLAFGLLMELEMVPKGAGLLLGSASFVGSFTMLATYVDADDATSIALFGVMYLVWGLYGVAAAFAEEPKNVAYNGLDIVSKNFYGVFLTVYAFTLV